MDLVQWLVRTGSGTTEQENLRMEKTVIILKGPEDKLCTIVMDLINDIKLKSTNVFRQAIN